MINEVSTAPVVQDEEKRFVYKLKEPIEVRLMAKEEVSLDAFIYRFILPDVTKILGHDTC